MKLIPEHGSCFMCGSENPHSLGLRWYGEDNGTIFTEVTLTLSQQGPPGHAHGGCSAALLDEAMGTAVWYAGHQVVAANLTVDYRRPVPLGVTIRVTGWVGEKNGRKIHTHGQIQLPDGTVAVVGKGLFVEAGHLFSESEGYAKLLDMAKTGREI